MSSVKEVRSVANACRVLEAIADRQPVGVSELAQVTGIDKSAAHRLAITLHHAGWLDRRANGRWSISPSLSTLVRDGTRSSLIDTVRPLLERARAATGETAMAVVAEGTHLRIVAVAESRQNLRVTATPGVEMPARDSSALRAIVPYLDDERLTAWRSVDPGLTDELLEEVRVRGWSYNDAELIPESRAVGVALRAPDGEPVAAFVICGPSTRFGHAQLDEYGPLVASLAEEWQAQR
jgi:IclR family acetate operon transcriptional repressor